MRAHHWTHNMHPIWYLWRPKDSANFEFQEGTTIFLKLKPGHFMFLLKVVQRLKSQLLCIMWPKPLPGHPSTFLSSCSYITFVYFLEYAKISHVFCLCTSACLPEIHPTSWQIHTHSSSFISPGRSSLTFLGSLISLVPLEEILYRGWELRSQKKGIWILTLSLIGATLSEFLCPHL